MTERKELADPLTFQLYCIAIALHIIFNINSPRAHARHSRPRDPAALPAPKLRRDSYTLFSIQLGGKFGSCLLYSSHHIDQFQPDPSASLIAPLGPPGYITVSLTFQDDFPTIYKTAIVLGGLQNSGNSIVAFTIEEVPASATSTSMDFSINLFSTTKLGYISFFYVIVATNSYFEIINC